ncbi:hypothetical protein ACFX2J_014277 [Malus domestica]
MNRSWKPTYAQISMVPATKSRIAQIQKSREQ